MHAVATLSDMGFETEEMKIASEHLIYQLHYACMSALLILKTQRLGRMHDQVMQVKH